MTDDERRALIESTPLACPLCAMPGPNGRRGVLILLRFVGASLDEKRSCPRCRVVVKLPRVALAAAIKRKER
jgi:hypothetical protein